jgi:hypothetical protein
MRHPRKTSDTPQLGSVRIDETLPLRELSRRWGWGKRAQADAVRNGLKAVTVGRMKITTGQWVRQFIERLAEKGGQVDEE